MHNIMPTNSSALSGHPAFMAAYHAQQQQQQTAIMHALTAGVDGGGYHYHPAAAPSKLASHAAQPVGPKAAVQKKRKRRKNNAASDLEVRSWAHHCPGWLQHGFEQPQGHASSPDFNRKGFECTGTGLMACIPVAEQLVLGLFSGSKCHMTTAANAHCMYVRW